MSRAVADWNRTDCSPAMVSVVPSARQRKLRLAMQLTICHVRNGVAGEALTPAVVEETTWYIDVVNSSSIYIVPAHSSGGGAR